LKQQLADIYKMGQVTIINQESIRRFMKKIINNIRKFEDQIWKCESLYDIEEKIESINNSIKKIDTSTGITNVNNFLQ
jgi:archaellum component FlaC